MLRSSSRQSRPLDKLGVTALVSAALLTLGAPVRAANVDVVVQSGHQGRPASCVRYHVAACNLGASNGHDREIVWTPIVADAVTAALRAAGFSVARRPADYPQHDTARFAVFIHFDGADPPCASGASAGFPPAQGPEVANRWERHYRALFPFRFDGENISAGESHYYGYRKVTAPKKMLVEFGELTCPAQAAWLRPRLNQLGVFLANFIESELR